MNDDFDDTGEDAELDKVRELIRTEGVRAAYIALKSVCEDNRAPAPAKATAGVALLRAAGLFEKTEDPRSKEPHQMTPDELDKHSRQLQRKLDRLRRRSAEGSVFD